MLFPITIGGFKGSTQLDNLLMDSQGGILMGGYTSDNSLTSYPFYLAYLPDGASTYAWFYSLTDYYHQVFLN
jgi:hypothetical protein